MDLDNEFKLRDRLIAVTAAFTVIDVRSMRLVLLLDDLLKHDEVLRFLSLRYFRTDSP